MIDELRAKWREGLFSFDLWILDSHRDSDCGMLDGVWLKPIENVAPYGAYLKPTRKCKVPVAAREKIAADLACDLGVPSVPVLLCDSKQRFGAQQDQCCVSLVTHPKVQKWTVVFTQAVLATAAGQQMVSSAPEPLSRIAVFDLWIDNRDRDNTGNLVYGEDSSDASKATFSALDHDVSMGGSAQSWQKGGWREMTLTPFPAKLRPLLDRDVMLRTARAIQEYSDEKIRDCVGRIPDRYMSSSAKNDTANGLIGRKPFLAALVLQHFAKG